MLYKLPGNYRLINFSIKYEAVGSRETSKTFWGSTEFHIPNFLCDVRKRFSINKPIRGREISENRFRDETLGAHNWGPWGAMILFIAQRESLRILF